MVPHVDLGLKRGAEVREPETNIGYSQPASTAAEQRQPSLEDMLFQLKSETLKP